MYPDLPDLLFHSLPCGPIFGVHLTPSLQAVARYLFQSHCYRLLIFEDHSSSFSVFSIRIDSCR